MTEMMNDDELTDDEWIDPLHYRSVTYAAKQWHVNFAKAWFKIDQAVRENKLNNYLPAIEFKIYISVAARANWIDALDERSVTYAAEQWRVQQATARARINQVVKEESLSKYLPVDEFKEYVQLHVKVSPSPQPATRASQQKIIPASHPLPPPLSPPRYSIGDYFSMAWIGVLYTGMGILFVLWIYFFFASQKSPSSTGPCASVAPEDRGECLDEYYAHPSYDPGGNYTPEPDDPYALCDENGCPWDNDGIEPGCNIKGNIAYDTGEKIYHLPGQEFYAVTVIDTAYGERWFCTEEEARANGWRKSQQ